MEIGLLALTDHVRTPEGARKFKTPIGGEIHRRSAAAKLGKLLDRPATPSFSPAELTRQQGVRERIAGRLAHEALMADRHLTPVSPPSSLTSAELVQQQAQRVASDAFERVVGYRPDLDGLGGSLPRMFKNLPAFADPVRAWTFYQMSDPYKGMQDALRGQTYHQAESEPWHDIPAGDTWNGAELASHVPAMFDQLGVTTTTPTTFYRGLHQSEHTDWEKTLTVGSVYREAGIMSTSASRGEILGYLGEEIDGPGATVLELHVPAGQRLVGGSIEGAGFETMFPPGTSFKVVKVEHRALSGDTKDPYSGELIPHHAASVQYVTVEVLS